MPESTLKGNAHSPSAPPESAITQIVQMNPRRVTVALSLPVAHTHSHPVVTLEWSREDTTMPLSDLLHRIETYVAQYGGSK